jgi:hypothetical protein
MSETNTVTPADPVHLVWSTLCEQGFDAAQHRAVSLLQDGSTPQLHADLEGVRDFSSDLVSWRHEKSQAIPNGCIG